MRYAKWIGLTAAFVLVAMAQARATQSALPSGWHEDSDGTVDHQESGAKCPAAINAIGRVSVDPPAPPVLGICQYAGDGGVQGLVRVRTYVPGQGETELTIANDKKLMEPEPGGDTPVAGMRGGPGPAIEGKATQQLVVTMRRNNLLVDCSGRMPKANKGSTHSDFALACLKLQ